MSLPVGLYPFWFWNDELDEAELRRQVAEIAAQGVSGFFIHSRQGLQQPYLSESFFRMVDVALEEAERHGLAVHLYDEYPYPSGAAGGEALLGNPQFWATALVQQAVDVPGGRVRLALPRGKVLACVACPLAGERADWSAAVDLRKAIGPVLSTDSYVLMGLTRYNRKRYFASDPVPTLDADLPPGPHRVFVSVQAVVEHHKYWGRFLDVLNPEAVREFIRLTHERYAARYGARLGDHFQSVFADETAPGWSERLPAEFARQCGYDLCASLPALQDAAHPDHLRVRADLRALTYRLFCESFEGPVSRWCREHGIRYAGEKPSMRLAQLRYMDVPGCEPGHTKAGAKMDLLGDAPRSNARATASAAYFYGKEGALCECYHSTGWSATLQDAKLVAEGLLLMGIRWLVPHGFFYSTHALRKHDGPPTFFFQMPYWPLFGRLTGRVARIAERLEGTHIEARVLVVDPTWGLPDEADRAAYVRMQQLLMDAHLDFLTVDTDILTPGRVAATDGELRIRDVRAALVLVPPMQLVEPALEAWLTWFEHAGGLVFRLPADFDSDGLMAQVLDVAQRALSIWCDGAEAAGVQCVTRAGGGRPRAWFVLNTTDRAIAATLDAGCPLREVALDDALPPALRPDGRRIIRPFESFLVEEAPEPIELPELARVRIPVEGPARVRPLGPNLLRIGEWEMALLDEGARAQGAPLQSARVEAVPLANQLQTGGFRFAPTLRQHFGWAPDLGLPMLSVRYTFEFRSTYTGPVELVMEPDSVVGRWTMRVNDGEPFGPERFAPTATHVRGSLRVDVSRWLRPGSNTMCVDLATDRLDGGLLNPLYLAGDFGVELAPLGLVERPAVGRFEAWEENGLPFYAGAVEYETEFELAAVPALPGPAGEEVLAEFDFGPLFRDAAEVSVNGAAFQALPWEPRAVRLPAGLLRPGRNRLTTRVYTTLIRSFEGQWFDYAAHAYRDVGP